MLPNLSSTSLPDSSLELIVRPVLPGQVLVSGPQTPLVPSKQDKNKQRTLKVLMTLIWQQEYTEAILSASSLASLKREKLWKILFYFQSLSLTCNFSRRSNQKYLYAKEVCLERYIFATTKAKLLKCISSELSMQSLALEVHNLAKGLAYSIK